MSFGSLSDKAIEALNKGAKKAGCYHNTGEGGLSPHHIHGADVTFQFGTGYFGVRDSEGNFDADKIVKLVIAEVDQSQLVVALDFQEIEKFWPLLDTQFEQKLLKSLLCIDVLLPY